MAGYRHVTRKGLVMWLHGMSCHVMPPWPVIWVLYSPLPTFDPNLKDNMHEDCISWWDCPQPLSCQCILRVMETLRNIYIHTITHSTIYTGPKEKRKNAIVSQQQANLPGMRNNCAHAWFVSLHGMSCHVMRAWPVMWVLHMYIDWPLLTFDPNPKDNMKIVSWWDCPQTLSCMPS